MDYIQSFARYEKKYLLTGEQTECFLNRAEEIIRMDCYGLHTICSIYLDLADFSLIRRSLEKPAYKEKLRIRSYGVPKGDSDVFFEIKKKFDGVVYKRRFCGSERDIEEYALTGIPSEGLLKKADPQIFSEADYIMQKLRPVPRVFVGYDRRAYVGKKDTSLRITIDKNVRCRLDNLRLSYGDSGTAITVCDNKFGSDYSLMEIKTDGALPFALARILSELMILPCSFSKYGEIYKQMILPALASQASNTAPAYANG